MISDFFKIGGIQYSVPRLGKNGFKVGTREWKCKYDKEHFLIKTVAEAFDEKTFMFPHTPMIIDEVFDYGKFSTKSNVRVLDMPIRMPYGVEYHIPKELNQFDEVISKIVSFEAKINPNVGLYYAYITVDQGMISAGKTQRRPGAHCDGLQTGYIRRPVSRTYIVYDNTPTTFYAQGFDTSYLDEEDDNYFLAFDDQAKEEAAITFDPYSILLTNAYTVHRCSPVVKDCYRTFLKITFDLFQYNRLGNTHNPQINYRWDMTEKLKQTKLKHKRKEDV
jgi:hypothetical protein